jgi:hypothetical protein
MARTDRIAVDALARDLLPPTPLQGLVYAEDEWSLWDERLHKQP